MTEIMPLLQAIGASVAWTVVGILLLYFGVKLFDLLDPIDYRQAIREGNIAAGIIVGTVILGISGIVVATILTP